MIARSCHVSASPDHYLLNMTSTTKNKQAHYFELVSVKVGHRCRNFNKKSFRTFFKLTQIVFVANVDPTFNEAEGPWRVTLVLQNEDNKVEKRPNSDDSDNYRPRIKLLLFR